MTFDDFVGEVQHRARLGSLGDAVRVIRCTLGVLSQRLAGGEAEDLASQLPAEIGYYLSHSETGAGQDLTVGEFLDRVHTCEGGSKPKPESIHHVRAVLQVLREAVSGGQVRHVLDQLPEDYRPLFVSGSEGKMRMGKAGTRGRTAGTARGPRRTRETAEAGETERPRSQRIARRASGAWHLGR